jgi:hypothetical protein
MFETVSHSHPGLVYAGAWKSGGPYMLNSAYMSLQNIVTASGSIAAGEAVPPN